MIGKYKAIIHFYKDNNKWYKEFLYFEPFSEDFICVKNMRPFSDVISEDLQDEYLFGVDDWFSFFKDIPNKNEFFVECIGEYESNSYRTWEGDYDVDQSFSVKYYQYVDEQIVKACGFLDV